MAQLTSSVQSIVFFAFCLATFFVRNLGVAAQDYPDCNGDTSLLGDALCDFSLNNADCGFDGGDCCECTCEDTIENACGSRSGFFCSDDNAPTNCTPTATPTASPTSLPVETPYPDCEGYLPHIQDGYCDADLNVVACDWDGGDCCACTCLEGLTHECGEKGDGFDCQDPNVPPDCNSANLAQCTASTYSYQDGVCDDDLNNAVCMWDGGDCCRCTCRDYTYDNDYSWRGYYYYDFGCGSAGYNCLDPDAPTVCDTEGPTPSPAHNTPYPDCEGAVYLIGDGYCNYVTNNEECDWDGGDCCDDGYCLSCYDPNADCVPAAPSPGAASYSDCAYPSWIGDGYCDSANNYEECSWDGGDCCQCGDYSPYGCIDPYADCDSTTTTTSYYGSVDDSPPSGYDGGSFGNRDTPSPATDGETRTASIDGEDSGFTGVQIIAIFTLTVFAFCCFGGTIVGSLFLLHRKWLEGESAAQRSVEHPRPSAPPASFLEPPSPVSKAREPEDIGANALTEGEAVDPLKSGGSGQPDGVTAGGPGADETKHTETLGGNEVKVAEEAIGEV